MTNKSRGSSFSSLVSLLIFYLFFIFLMILFAGRVIRGGESGNDLYLVVLWFAALIVPVVLLLSIISNVLRLLRERRDNAPGVILKTRLIMYFVVMVILSAAPQAFLSVNFIRIIGDTWFSQDIGTGLQNSLDIAVEVQQQLSDDLESFVYTPLFEGVAQRASENPDRVFVQLRQIRPSIAAFQVFDAEGRELSLQGDTRAGVNFSDIQYSPEALVVRDVRQAATYIRIKRQLITENESVWVVVMEELPADFGTRSLAIVRALELFDEYQGVRNLLFTGILVFYAVFAIPLIFLAILTGFYLSDILIRPIADLEDATRRVAEGDFSFRILAKSREEFGHLVGSFNAMISELEKSRVQLLQSERISAWKDIAQRLAHEIKNPLTPIKLSAQRLERKYEKQAEDFPEVLNRSVASIIREVDHLAGLLTEFRDFARLPFPQPEQVHLKRLISEVWDIHRKSNVECNVSGVNENQEVFVDSAQFRQVLGNLVKNSIEAFEDGPGTLKFSCQLVKIAGRDIHRILVQDDGPGIPEADQGKIFDPYYTGKADGTGLGLAIVRRIIQDHNGDIRVESDLGHGTRFYIDLPLPGALASTVQNILPKTQEN